MIPKEEREKMIDKTLEISVFKQCYLLNISRSSFYYVAKEESEENIEIMALMDRQYLETPFYGYRKMLVWVISKGYNINAKRIKRLMKIMNWKTIYQEPKTTIIDKGHKKYPYLLKGLKIVKPNQVWATDITYIPMVKGFMYLTAIIDLHTRYVLNWQISNHMGADWCASFLKETIELKGKPEIFNTDQGSQYTSDLHTSILLDNNISISMDGKGRAIDNIFIERLWRTVKYEDIYLRAYSSGKELNDGLKAYFSFYNKKRPHQSLDYKSPYQYYYEKMEANMSIKEKDFVS